MSHGTVLTIQTIKLLNMIIQEDLSIIIDKGERGI